MGRRNKNTFSKALGHLKSRSIDEKLQMLSERPANSTAGYMTAVGSQTNPDFVSTERGQENNVVIKKGRNIFEIEFQKSITKMKRGSLRHHISIIWASCMHLSLIHI